MRASATAILEHVTLSATGRAFVTAGASTLVGCAISGGGVACSPNGKLRMSHCRVSVAARQGVSCSGPSETVIERTAIANTCGNGIVASGRSCALRLSWCEVSAAGSDGVVAECGAKIRLTETTIRRCGGSGIAVCGPAAASLRGVRVIATEGTGICCSRAGDVDGVDVEVRGAGGDGLRVEEGSRVRIERGWIVQVAGCGVRSEGGSVVRLMSAAMGSCGGGEVREGTGGAVDMEDCDIGGGRLDAAPEAVMRNL